MWSMMVPFLVAAASAAPRGLPQQRQGALAWMNFEAHPSGFLRTGVNRLITHSVQDDTLLSKYLPRVRAFLLWAIGGGFRVRTRSDLDFVLADYFELGCYKWAKGLDWCANTFFGLICCFPELRERLPIAYRAYKAFQRLFVPSEGQAIPEELVYVMSERWRSRGLFDYALVCETSMDCYWRQGEWERLRRQDVSDDGVNIAFILGVALRGERVKTGHNQGVIVDSPVLAAEWRQKLADLEPGQRIFDFTQQEFLVAWRSLAKELGVSVGPPHDLRHSGAARDALAGRRSLEEIRRRGRWAALSSVGRYTKTFLLVRARAALPAALLREGARLAKERGPRTT